MTSKNKIIIITLILLGVIIYATASHKKAENEKQQLLPLSEMPLQEESYSSDSSVRNEGQPVSRHLDATQTRTASSGVSGTQEISTYHNGSSSLHTVICTVTAYSPDYESTGKTPDHPSYKRTATGSTAEEGRTVAADFDFLPPGSLIEIEGIGLRVVEDTGGGLSYGHIDLYFETHEQAVEFGTKRREIKVLRLGKA